MEINFASEKDIPALYELWNVCFGDGKDTVDMFFRNSFKPENTLCAFNNKKLIAMLFLLPENIRYEGRDRPSYYLYALGTDPSFRRQGIMGDMIEYAAALSIKRNKDYLFLVPADKKLFSYYEKHGFYDAFRQKRITAQRERLKSNAEVITEEFSPVRFRNIRNGNLSGENFVDWNESEIKLSYEYFISGSGECVTGDNFSFFTEHKKDCDRVYDFTFDESSQKAASEAIFNHTIKDCVEIYSSVKSLFPADNQEYYYSGMARPLKSGLSVPEAAFMGITLG